MLKWSLAALLLGFFLDLCFGDPHWLPHPIRFIGWLIHHTERWIRPLFPKGKRGEQISGSILVAIVLLISTGIPLFLLVVAFWINPWIYLLAETVMCYQILAVKSLRDESMKVYFKLKENNPEAARQAVSMIVGRDTERLSEEGIAKAAIETIAENTSDGVVAPLFFLMLGGAPLGFFYKAANTMDSMIGYRNETYLHFGRTAAKLDDLLNFIPSRIAAWLMILVCPIVRLDVKNAVRIFRRDRFQHASPNSAQTEAVCAGALGVQLAGDAWYFGKHCRKPTIGDPLRPVEPEDIRRANHLLYATAVLAVLLALLIALLGRFCCLSLSGWLSCFSAW